jgi:hypothetical protein
VYLKQKENLSGIVALISEELILSSELCVGRGTNVGCARSLQTLLKNTDFNKLRKTDQIGNPKN